MGKSDKKREVLIAPCKGCTERAVGCHGKCEKYQEYARKKQEVHDYFDPYVDYVRKRNTISGRWLNGK